jgi:hypothetical protein
LAPADSPNAGDHNFRTRIRIEQFTWRLRPPVGIDLDPPNRFCSDYAVKIGKEGDRGLCGGQKK